MDSPLLTKSKQFALDIIKVCNTVKSTKKDTVLTNQLLRSGTSIGANIREAFYGHRRADFIANGTQNAKNCCVLSPTAAEMFCRLTQLHLICRGCTMIVS